MKCDLLLRNSKCVMDARCALVWQTSGRGLPVELESCDPVAREKRGHEIGEGEGDKDDFDEDKEKDKMG